MAENSKQERSFEITWENEELKNMHMAPDGTDHMQQAGLAGIAPELAVSGIVMVFAIFLIVGYMYLHKTNRHQKTPEQVDVEKMNREQQEQLINN